MRDAVVLKHLMRSWARLGRMSLEPLASFACQWIAELETVGLSRKQRSVLPVGRHRTSNPHCKCRSLAAGVDLERS
jgi:hypothetical protein